MALSPRQVYRRYVTDGVPDSGKWDPPKDLIIQLLEQIAGGTAAVGDYRGVWSNSEDYVAKDYVQSGGSIWYAKRDSQNVVPTEGDDWSLLLPGATVADGAVTQNKYADASIFFTKLASDVTTKLIRNVGSVANMKTLLPTAYNTLYLNEGKKRGLFYKDTYANWSAIVTADPTEGFVVRSTADPAVVWVREGAVAYPEHFGAQGDWGPGNTGTNDLAAINAWWAAGRALRMKGIYLGVKSLYRVSGTLTFNMSNTAAGQNAGGHMLGTDPHHSGFMLDNGFFLQLVCNSGDAAFYEHFRNFRVNGNIPGNPVFVSGRGDLTDALNGCDLDLVVNNNATGSVNCVGARINYHLNSFIRIVANCGGSGRPDLGTGGYGVALHLRQAQFNTFNGSWSNARTGLLMNDGYVYGNTFGGNMDIEEVQYGVEISGANVTRNEFLAGTILGQYTFSCSAGSNNCIHEGVVRATYAGGGTGPVVGLTRPTVVAY